MTEPDLRAVDDLCRLALAARRAGCRIHLDGAGPELRALIDLAGLGEVLVDCPLHRPPVSRVVVVNRHPVLRRGPASAW